MFVYKIKKRKKEKKNTLLSFVCIGLRILIKTISNRIIKISYKKKKKTKT